MKIRICVAALLLTFSAYADAQGLEIGEAVDSAVDLTEVIGSAERLQWFAVTDQDAKAKPSQYGLYIVKDGKIASFIRTKQAQLAGDILLSPNGRYALIDFGDSPIRELRVYVLAGSRLLAAVPAMADIVWISDTNFAFTLVDSKVPSRSAFDPNCGTSVAVFNVIKNSMRILFPASAKTDYLCLGITGNNKLRILERRVNTLKDWDSQETVEHRDFAVDIEKITR